MTNAMTLEAAMAASTLNIAESTEAEVKKVTAAMIESVDNVTGAVEDPNMPEQSAKASTSGSRAKASGSAQGITFAANVSNMPSMTVEKLG